MQIIIHPVLNPRAPEVVKIKIYKNITIRMIVKTPYSIVDLEKYLSMLTIKVPRESIIFNWKNSGSINRDSVENIVYKYLSC